MTEDDILEEEALRLEGRIRRLDQRKAHALGDLILALKGGALEAEMLAGAILSALRPASAEEASRYRRRGAAYFRRLQGGASQAGRPSRPSQARRGARGPMPTSRGAPPPPQP